MGNSVDKSTQITAPKPTTVQRQDQLVKQESVEEANIAAEYDVLLRGSVAAAELPPEGARRLQTVMGNRAGAGLTASRNINPNSELTIQPRLTVGPADDKYEREADEVANRVVGKLSLQSASTDSESALQRTEREEDESQIQAKSLTAAIRRSASADGGPVDAQVERSIRSSRGNGQPMDNDVRTSMENAFGADFGNVKVHTDARSDELNRTLSARAFTTGQDIYFRKGEYNPSSTEGKKLIAHELTHVVQQTGYSIGRMSDDKMIQHRQQKSYDRDHMTGLFHQHPNLVQRDDADGAADAPATKNKSWWRLAIEATGHFIQSIVQTTGGLISAIGTGGAALLPGIVAAVGGVGQAIIGICKSVRAHILRKGRDKDEQAYLKNLIMFEGSIGTATAISGIVSGSLSPDVWKQVVTIVSKSVDTLSGIIKSVRGFNLNKWKNTSTYGILIMIESALGFLSSLTTGIANAIASGAEAIFTIVSQIFKSIVTLFKGARGRANSHKAEMAQEGGS